MGRSSWYARVPYLESQSRRTQGPFFWIYRMPCRRETVWSVSSTPQSSCLPIRTLDSSPKDTQNLSTSLSSTILTGAKLIKGQSSSRKEMSGMIFQFLRTRLGKRILHSQQQFLLVILMFPPVSREILVSLLSNHLLRHSIWIHSIEPLQLQGLMRMLRGSFSSSSPQQTRHFLVWMVMREYCSIFSSRSRMSAGSLPSFWKLDELVWFSTTCSSSRPNFKTCLSLITHYFRLRTTQQGRQSGPREVKPAIFMYLRGMVMTSTMGLPLLPSDSLQSSLSPPMSLQLALLSNSSVKEVGSVSSCFSFLRQNLKGWLLGIFPLDWWMQQQMVLPSLGASSLQVSEWNCDCSQCQERQSKSPNYSSRQVITFTFTYISWKSNYYACLSMRRIDVKIGSLPFGQSLTSMCCASLQITIIVPVDPMDEQGVRGYTDLTSIEMEWELMHVNGPYPPKPLLPCRTRQRPHHLE